MIPVLIQIALLLLLPPLMLGVIARTKAWVAGRRGPPLLQAYFDLAKLMRKQLVISTTTTWVFVAGPVITASAVFLSGLMIPAAGFAAPVAFAGDAVLFAYLFGLARFFTASAALDTGSAFEGMGATREITFASLSEPTLFCGLLVLARRAETWSLTGMLQSPSWTAGAPLALVAAGLFIVLLAETCRIPVDDPCTHLELTMIHEVMVLDHSGPLFGAILYTAAMKLYILGSLFLLVAVPVRSGNTCLDGGLFVAGMLGLSVAVGVVESVMARLRMRHVPSLLVGALLCCAFGFVLSLR